jgi:hypothetical protein
MLKMAEVNEYGSTAAPVKSAHSLTNIAPECKFCTNYKGVIESLFSELQTVKKIIQLLQDDLSNTGRQQRTDTLTSNYTPQVSPATNNWEITSNRKRKSGNHTNYPNTSPYFQNHIPVIQTSNCYHVLHNLQEEQLKETYKMKRTNKIQKCIAPANPGEPMKIKIKMKTQVKPLKKITLIEDSHTRGLAAELRTLIGSEYAISSTFMPGAGLQNITKLAERVKDSNQKRHCNCLWGI